jgi:TorA maturation chaperone TorD
MGPAHHSALAWYRQSGVEPSIGNQPSDHLGLMLLFAAHLIESGGAIELFAGAHLAWVPDFCRSVAQETRLEYFRVVANRTAEMVETLAPVTR